MEHKIMTAKPKNILAPHLGDGDKDMNRHARLFIFMSWGVLIIALVTALALWLAGAQIPIILLLVPLILAGVVILIATNRLRADLDAQL
jgi:archaellum biogenesis protein FlaJ (TadC family)